MSPKMREHLKNAFPYPPGRPIEEVQREFGLKSVVKLASNENPLGPSPLALKAMARCAKESHLYPDGGGHYLRQALAEKHLVKPEQIILGAGSDDLTTFIALCYWGPGKNVVTSSPSFIRYEQNAIVAASDVKRVPMMNWRNDVRALLEAVGPKTAAVCVANPENPVGCMMTKRETALLVKGLPESVFLLLDGAYHEYLDGEPNYDNGLRYLKRHKNLMITRTFSKAYGLAGLRVGYGISTPEIIETLNRVRPPFNVTRIAQEAALAALGDDEHLKKSRELNDTGMAYYKKELDRLGLEWIPSFANFITFNTRRDGGAVFQALLARGVIVRPMAGYRMPAWLRVSIGLPGENKRCIRELEKVLNQIPEA